RAVVPDDGQPFRGDAGLLGLYQTRGHQTERDDAAKKRRDEWEDARQHDSSPHVCHLLSATGRAVTATAWQTTPLASNARGILASGPAAVMGQAHADSAPLERPDASPLTSHPHALA